MVFRLMFDADRAGVVKVAQRRHTRRQVYAALPESHRFVRARNHITEVHVGHQFTQLRDR